MITPEDELMINRYFDEKLNETELVKFKKRIAADELLRKTVFQEYLLRKTLNQRIIEDLHISVDKKNVESNFYDDFVLKRAKRDSSNRNLIITIALGVAFVILALVIYKFVI